MKNNKTKYNVYSPDGFTISRDDTYNSLEEAVDAFMLWVQRYEEQGYYSSVEYGRIPLELLIYFCDFVELDG